MQVLFLMIPEFATSNTTKRLPSIKRDFQTACRNPLLSGAEHEAVANSGCSRVLALQII